MDKPTFANCLSRPVPWWVHLTLGAVILALQSGALAQPGSEQTYQRIDGIVAVVGDEIVLMSDILDRVSQARLEGRDVSQDNQCGLLESMLFEKLLLHNARLDSLEVTDLEVMGEIDRRLTYYLQMFGSVEAFEAEYGKSVAEWKAEFNDPVREQILAQKMQAEIDQTVRSTPAQVQDYFNAIPADSLPLIPRNSATASWSCSRRWGNPKNAHPQQTGLDSDLGGNGENQHDPRRHPLQRGSGVEVQGGCYNNIGRGQFVPEFEGPCTRRKSATTALCSNRTLDTTSCASRTDVASNSAPVMC